MFNGETYEPMLPPQVEIKRHKKQAIVDVEENVSAIDNTDIEEMV